MQEIFPEEKSKVGHMSIEDELKDVEEDINTILKGSHIINRVSDELKSKKTLVLKLRKNVHDIKNREKAEK